MNNRGNIRSGASLNWHIVGYTLLALFVALLTSALIAHPAGAATTVPTKMNFQGRLTDASGTVVADGLYNMKFAIYDDPTAGTQQWTETRQTTNRVQVTNGIFSVKLGDVTPLPASVFSAATRYFEITLANPATATCSIASCQTWESAMTRNQIATSAYAYNADTLDGIDGASFAQYSTTNAFTGTNSITVSNANAFVVAGAYNLFRVDTSGTQVLVGTTDANANLFVLDTKNTAGDPAGVAGGIYYNSDAGKLRCYEVTTWKDCVTTVSTTLQDAYDNDSSGVADITTSSTAKTFLFKAGATYDSATLFDIQDAGGANIFTVDTSNDRVYIGDSTADGVGAVLVVDTKNTAGNPTGVDGAMYYNSDEKSFRCYKNGLWADCNFKSLRSEWVLQEDFNSNTITVGTGADLGNIGNNNWTAVSIGTGGTLSRTNVGTDASNRDRIGVMQMNSPATSGTGISVRLDNTGIAGVPSNMTVEFDFAPVNAAAATGQQTITRIGLLDSVTTAAPTDGMYFQYSTTTTAGNWFRCTQTTCVDTGVARTTTANVYQRFKIQTNSAGTAVEFFINEASVGSVSTNLPGATASYGPTINTSTVDATIRQWKIDYFQIYRSLSTLR